MDATPKTDNNGRAVTVLENPPWTQRARKRVKKGILYGALIGGVIGAVSATTVSKFTLVLVLESTAIWLVLGVFIGGVLQLGPGFDFLEGRAISSSTLLIPSFNSPQRYAIVPCGRKTVYIERSSPYYEWVQVDTSKLTIVTIEQGMIELEFRFLPLNEATTVELICLFGEHWAERIATNVLFGIGLLEPFFDQYSDVQQERIQNRATLSLNALNPKLPELIHVWGVTFTRIDSEVKVCYADNRILTQTHRR